MVLASSRLAPEVTAELVKPGPFSTQPRELFYSYDVGKACSSGDDAVPFEPSRTVDVGPERWQLYAHTSLLAPQERAEREAAGSNWRQWLLHCGRPFGGGKGHANQGWSIFGLPMLRPDSKWVLASDVILTLVDLTYTAFMVPISLAFDFAATRPGPHYSWLTIMDVVGTAFYAADIALNFSVGFIVRYDVQRALVMEGRKVASFYIRNGTFMVDFVATLSIIPELVLASLGTIAQGYNLFYMLRLLRLLRVTRLLRAVGGTALVTNPVSRAALQHVSTAVLYLFNLIFSLAVLVNLLGCLWIFTAQMEGFGNSWVAATELQHDLQSSSPVALWVAAVYFTTTTVTTVGYGDITPVTVAEQLITVAFMVVGVLFFGFAISVISDVLQSASRKARLADQLRLKLEDTEAWMKERRMPPDLRIKVQRFYLEVWAQHGGVADAQYFADLPVALRGEIVSRLAGPALRRSHVLRRLDEEVQGQLASAAVPVRLVAGHNLYEEGDDSTSFFFLQEGEALAIRGSHVTATFKSPALVGQAAIFASEVDDCRTRLHTVRGLTNCTLWEFKSSDLKKVTKHRPDVMVTLCKAYLRYLETAAEGWRSLPQAMPRRMPRMQKGVQDLLLRMEQKARGKEAGAQAEVVPPGEDANGAPAARPSPGTSSLVRPSMQESLIPEEAEEEELQTAPASDDDTAHGQPQQQQPQPQRQQGRGARAVAGPRSQRLLLPPFTGFRSEDGSTAPPEQETLGEMEAGQLLAPAGPEARSPQRRGSAAGSEPGGRQHE